MVTLQARSKEGFGFKTGFGANGTFYLQKTTTYTSEDANPEITYKINVDTAESSSWDGSAIDLVETYTRNGCGYEYDATGYTPEEFAGTSETQQFANEYTDDDLIADVFECLGEFGEWSDNSAPTAVRELVDTLYTESVIEVRITHPPTATGYLKARLFKRVRAYNSETDTYGAPTDSLLTTYEWTGEPADSQYSINHAENLVVGATIAVERGDLNTRVQIAVAKWSLIEGYEPDDPEVDSENDHVLIRPTPDCESNGVPALNEDCPFRE